MVFCISLLYFIVILLLGNTAAWNVTDVGSYFETPQENKFNLNILPEYPLERHTFYTPVELAANGMEETILYRIPGGPKSAPRNGKLPTFIQYGILCDVDQCIVNQPLIAIAYLLIDQDYDVWLGKSNSSVTGNIILSEDMQKEYLAPVAQYVLEKTGQPELSVMGYYNGSIKIFGISATPDEPEVNQQNSLSSWLDFIPGVKTVKKLYSTTRDYLTRSIDRVIDSFDYVGRKLDYVIDDLHIREVKQKILDAWGIVTTELVPTLNIDDFSKTIDHPDVHLSTPELLLKYGYQPEIHKIQTSDGYILTAHRIAGGPKHPPRSGKPVVFLQHGILSSSADWIIMGPLKSLGYLLSDEGYDVWMGNSRGNTYSKAHVNISPSKSEFWDFSWHEMGVRDIPAVIDYILNITEETNVSYIGHSQGVSQLLVTLSEKPEYNSKISFFTAFAPMAYAGNMRSPIVTPFAKISTPLYYLLRLVGVNSFLPTNAFLTEIGRDVCEARSIMQIICSNTLFLATGYDQSQMNKTLVPIILGHVPAGASTKQFVHYAQLYNSKKFRQFDYSVSFLNRQKYGRSEPPEYNLQNVRVPVAIYYGQNDLLADSKDVEKLGNELPNVVLKHKVSLEKFNHVDFLYGIDVPTLVYQQVIQSLHQNQNLVP